jgi:hypothetical protein
MDDPVEMTGIVVLGLVLFLFLFFFIYMPIIGIAPSFLIRFEARLLRCLKCKKPGAKPFTYNEIVPNVYLGALPHNPEEIRSLKDKCNVAGFVTMNCSWELPGNNQTMTLEEVTNEGIEMCHLPTPDYSGVSYTNLLTGADFVKKIAEDNDQGCYIHCNAGKGRSTMVVLAYLIKYQGMTSIDALKHIEGKRKIANFLCCCGIRPQWRGVRHFEQKVRGGGNKSGGRVAPVSPASSPATDRKQQQGTTQEPELIPSTT